MIKKKRASSKLTVDLTGPDGNAFYLLGLARKLGTQLGYDKEELDEVSAKMRAGDYENLVKVFDDAFGAYVTLYR